LTDPGPGRLGYTQPGWLGWANGPMGQSPFASLIQIGKKIEILFFLLKLIQI
jgi:hypothetical protein